MWAMSSSCLALATVVLFSTFYQGVTDQSACRLVLSKNKNPLAVRVRSSGELNCYISSECDLSENRVIGPFWRRPNGKWFVSNWRVSNTRINSTMISLRYIHIDDSDFGVYICVARIGRQRLSVIANITQQVNRGDIPVTNGPDISTLSPSKRKKRSAVSVVQAAPPRKNPRDRRAAGRSIPGPTIDLHQGIPLLSNAHAPERNHESQPLKTPCEEDKLFSKTGIIIVAALVCSTFLLLYMVILLMAVPRICFPYYPKKNKNADNDERSTDSIKNKESSPKVDIPLSHKVRPNGRSDSGIESVDGLEERGSHNGGGRNGSHWEIGTDKLEEFYRRTTNQGSGSDEDMLSGLKRYNIEKNIPRRGRSESVPVTPYRYQSSIYVKV